MNFQIDERVRCTVPDAQGCYNIVEGKIVKEYDFNEENTPVHYIVLSADTFRPYYLIVPEDKIEKIK